MPRLKQRSRSQLGTSVRRLVRLDYAEGDKEYGFIRAVKKDLAEDYTPIIAIVGRPRVGKSMAGLAIARRFDKDFSIQRNCFFDMKDFLEKSDRAYGRWFLIDEADEKMNRQEYQSPENKVMNSILRTQAINKNPLVFVLPALNSLATQQIPYINYVVLMKYRGIAKTIGFEYKWDSLERKLKAINKWTLDNKMRVPWVPKEIVEEYKKKERADKEAIYQRRKNEYFREMEKENPDVDSFIMPGKKKE